jgi:hypothetical protein
MARKKRHGFAAYSEDKRIEIARSGGNAVQEKGKAYVFTRRAAKKASLKRFTRTNYMPLRSRVREGRYEYHVDGLGWVSRQRVYLLRKSGVGLNKCGTNPLVEKS